jgi:poly(3-hydroxybutyrate) depolymerase
MSRAIAAAAVVALLVCLCSQAQAQTPGQATTVTCKASPNQTYACYVPAKYSKKKKWPILYCYSPGGNGMSFVRMFKDVCERQGWIVVGSNNARNGPGGPIITAMKAMWKDTHDRFSINDKRCYASGFSGGSGMAFGMAQAYPDNFAGVIPMAVAGSWSKSPPDIAKHIAVCFIIGDKDMVAHVKKTAEALKAKGNKTEVKVFSGGHTLPPKNVAEGAVDWLVKVAPKGSGGRSSSGKAKKPTQLELEKEVAKRVQLGARKAARGDLAGALRIAEKIIKDTRAKDEDKVDAKLLKDEIEKLRDKLFADAAKLLEEKKPYESMQLYVQIRGAFAGSDTAKKAQKKITEIKTDESLKEELAAGKLYVKGLDYEAKDKKDKAQKCFEQVVENYPDTEYAKRAKEKLQESK